VLSRILGQLAIVTTLTGKWSLFPCTDTDHHEHRWTCNIQGFCTCEPSRLENLADITRAISLDVKRKGSGLLARRAIVSASLLRPRWCVS
jgi:hypothetical protein